MVRLVSAISAGVMLCAPMAAAAQQQFVLDPAVLQQFAQGQASSTIGLQILQGVTQLLPVAQTYLQDLNAGANTNAIVERLEMMLKDPKFVAAVQVVAAGQQVNPNQPAIDALLGQVATIQKQIDALLAGQGNPAPVQQQVAPPAPAPAAANACPAILRNLIFGVNGDDVLDLQEFLIEKGLLEAGNATGFFGKLTEAAVQKWQQAMNIVAQGDPFTNGFGAVGPLTRAALQNCQ